jgi:hypothetical protein
MTDLLRYIEMSNPIFIKAEAMETTFRPLVEGFSY